MEHVHTNGQHEEGGALSSIKPSARKSNTVIMKGKEGLGVHNRFYAP
jgi:hypothetical protein